MKEEMRQRELEEMRARVAQMEKTMRWWSDCTTNWRVKWSKVRNERNQAREECRSLKFKLESLAKENTVLKKNMQDLEYQIKRNSDNCRMETKSFHSDQSFDKIDVSLSESPKTKLGTEKADNNTPLTIENCRLNSSEPKLSTLTSLSADDISPIELNKVIIETKEKLIKENKEKLKLTETLSSVQTQLEKLTEQYEELHKSKLDSDEEIIRLRQWREERMEAMKSDLEDGMMSDTNSEVNNRLTDLHKELEKMQLENAAEWALREKLETEKLSLERENRRLKSEIVHVTEELTKNRLSNATNCLDASVSLLQEEINEKNKELAEIKHAHGRLKKLLQDRSSELEHSRSRAEHYELEVKKLRTRVEELKKQLANAEDEADQSLIQMKKMQRTIEELQQQLDSSDVKVQHLQSRLRQSRTSLVGSEEGEDITSDAMSLGKD